MKFTIRSPFAVHLQTLRRFKRDGRDVSEAGKVESFFAGEPVELDEKSARVHLHKLEPADDAAREFIERFHAEANALRAGRMQRPDSLTSQATVAEISSSVVQALIASGIVKAPK